MEQTQRRLHLMATLAIDEIRNPTHAMRQAQREIDARLDINRKSRQPLPGLHLVGRSEPESRPAVGTASSSRGGFDFDAFMAPRNVWQALEHEEREPLILEAVAGQRLTVSEICAAVMKARPDLFVHAGTIRNNLNRLTEANVLSREPEIWRGKTRYRYFQSAQSPEREGSRGRKA